MKKNQVHTGQGQHVFGIKMVKKNNESLRNLSMVSKGKDSTTTI